MKLNSKTDIVQFIKSPSDRFRGVLIYGENYGLISTLLSGIRERLLGDVLHLNYDEIKRNPQKIQMASSSLFSARTIALVRNIGESINKELEAVLNCNRDCYCVFIAENLSSKSTLRTFFEKSAHYACIACYEDSAEVLPQVIRKWCENQDVSHETSDIETLSSIFRGTDRLAVLSELNKLALFFTGQFTAKEILDLLEVERSSDITKLCFAVLDGKLNIEVFKETTRINDYGTIARSIARYASRIASAQSHVASGKSPDDAMAQLYPPVFFKLRGDFVRHINNVENARDIAKTLAVYEVQRPTYNLSEDVVLYKILVDLMV